MLFKVILYMSKGFITSQTFAAYYGIKEAKESMAVKMCDENSRAFLSATEYLDEYIKPYIDLAFEEILPIAKRYKAHILIAIDRPVSDTEKFIVTQLLKEELPLSEILKNERMGKLGESRVKGIFLRALVKGGVLFAPKISEVKEKAKQSELTR